MVASRAPVIPRGWPSAMAPPLALTCSASSGRPSSRRTASPCEANASFSSITSNCLISSFANARAFRVAGTGPMPIIRGSTPAVAPATMRARGVNLKRRTASSDAMTSAHAPSFTPEALPAVTVPLVRKGVGNLASCSRVVSGRGCSSRATTNGLLLRCGISTGMSSDSKKPRA